MSVERLSEMIQELSSDDFMLVSGIVERLSMKNNMFHFPLDDEPTTAEDIHDVQIAKQALKNQEYMSLKDLEDDLRS